MAARYGVTALALWASSARAAPWLVTQYVEVVESTIFPATTIGEFTDPALIDTYTIAVTPTITPAPKPTKIVVSSDPYQSDVTNVFIEMPTGGVATLDTNVYVPDNQYFIPIVYHAPSTCADPWTYTYTAIPPLPYNVRPSGSFISYDTIFSASDIMLKATQFPSSVVASLSATNFPTWATGCTIPYYVTETYDSASYPTNYYSGGDSNDYNDYSGCDPFELDFGGSVIGGGYICGDEVDYTYGLSFVGFICVWIFSWLGFFLICGLLENWFTFRALSLGKSARRGLPICFACMFPLLSCLLLLGSRAGYQAKSTQEQQTLRQRWNALPAHSAFGQWMSWGFRFKYPPFLGTEPPIKGQAVPQTAPQMIAAPGGYYVYQPNPTSPLQSGAPGAPGGPGVPVQTESFYPPAYAAVAPKQPEASMSPLALSQASPVVSAQRSPPYSPPTVAQSAPAPAPTAPTRMPPPRSSMSPPPPPGHHELE